MALRLAAVWLRAFSVFLVIVLITLGLLEGILRLTVDRASLYRGLSLYPTHNRKKFESEFLARNAGKALNMETFDPQLGWDFDIAGDRIRGDAHHPLDHPPHRYRIVAIGDSFTYGTDVETDQSFPAFLQRRLCHTEVLNMGVPGYGIDQAVLKYLGHGAAYAPDSVILGIFPDDFERASLSFHAFSKPWFEPMPGGGHVLSNQPVPPPQAERERIRREQALEPYSLALLTNLGLQLRTLIQGKEHALKRIDSTIIHALLRLQTELRRTDTQLLIVQIPGAERFTRAQTSWEHSVTEHLRGIYRTLEIAHVDLYETFHSEHSPEQVVADFYVRRDDGTSGHLSARGNAAAAAFIAKALQSIDQRLPRLRRLSENSTACAGFGGTHIVNDPTH